MKNGGGAVTAGAPPDRFDGHHLAVLDWMMAGV